MKRNLPDPIILHKMLRYDSQTGFLFWLVRGVEFFADGKHPKERTCAKWNARFAGKQAFNINIHGYKMGFILGQKISAHRVIWAMCYGSWPDGEIDHVDGNTSNNTLENLRIATHQQNCLNRKLRKDSTSGVKGVSWHAATKKWRARVMTNGIRVVVGSFDCIQDAERAVRSYREIAHGVFSRHA